ncbi:MAG: prefoldin subunit alpha [Nanoarchaeota archaeon]|nr:prefoldin subunit alpha [Nanoarchaeota archaeon]
MTAEEMQQKYAEYQMLTSQVKQLVEQMQALEHQTRELEMLIEGVEELGKSSKGTEVLAALGGGLYVKTKLEKNNEVIINSGAKVMTTKTTDEAKALLSEQLGEVKKIIASMQQGFQEGVSRIAVVEAELRKAQNKAAKK